MKNLILISLFILAGTNIFGQTGNQQNSPATATKSSTYTRPEASERFKKYLNNSFGPTAYIGPVFSATFRQINNKPEEWGKTSKGFARRFGDSVGRNVLNQTVTYGLDEALKLDSNYYRSTKKDFKSKFSNAVVSTFTARNKNGKRVLGAPRIIGTYSSAIIANEVWMPKRFDYKDGLRDGTVSIGTRVVFNLFREFILKK